MHDDELYRCMRMVFSQLHGAFDTSVFCDRGRFAGLEGFQDQFYHFMVQQRCGDLEINV